jgi:hypothetical protein
MASNKNNEAVAHLRNRFVERTATKLYSIYLSNDSQYRFVVSLSSYMETTLLGPLSFQLSMQYFCSMDDLLWNLKSAKELLSRVMSICDAN